MMILAMRGCGKDFTTMIAGLLFSEALPDHRVLEGANSGA
jgi:hypothetical protein